MWQLAGPRYDYTIGTTQLWWDELIEAAGDRDDYDFIAFYPTVPDDIISDNLIFDFNATTAGNPDLLMANTTVYKGATVNLNFCHIMHKLIVNLSSDDFTDGALSEALVRPFLKSTARVKMSGARTGTAINADETSGALDELPLPLRA